MAMEFIQNQLAASGLTPSTDVGDPTMNGAPTLNDLLLNPSMVPGVEAPPQVPYEYGYGPQTTQNVNPPMLPPGQTADQAASSLPATDSKGKPQSWTDQIAALGKVLSAFGGAGKAMKDSPLAQRMFQERQQAQMVQNQINQGKIQEFKRRDLASQILAQYGLL